MAGALSGLTTITGNKGSAGTLLSLTDGVNSSFEVITTSLLTTIGNGGGSADLALKANDTEYLRLKTGGTFLVKPAGTTSADVAGLNDGAFSFTNYNGAAPIPTFISKSTSNIGLYLITAVADNNPASADVLFGVRETDNTDFSGSYNTKVAYSFRRYAATLMDIKRNGDVVINGNLTVTGEISAYGAGTIGLDSAPASMTAAGTAGERRFCSDGIYVCIATNTWRKATYSTF